MDTLIIAAPLSCPPSELLAFRTLTMYAKCDLKMDVLLETEHTTKDSYYHFLRERGGLDCIAQFVEPQDLEEGVRIDIDYNFPLTIMTDRIVWLNVQNLYEQLKSLRRLAS